MATEYRRGKRPAELIGSAIAVAQISVGDIDDQPKIRSVKVRSGYAGAQGRAQKFTPEKRQEMAKQAADARWR